jgi:hypothetical protein
MNEMQNDDVGDGGEQKRRTRQVIIVNFGWHTESM